MEKNQYELCIEIFRQLNKAKLLNDVILIGSWCQPFYKTYFGKTPFNPVIRTRDIDFLIPNHRTIKVKTDIPALLKPLGFVVSFVAPEGYIRLEHPDLIIEFLTPEKGKGTNGPIPLPKLGINLVALRFLNLLTANVIKLEVENIKISLPHPANYALHKLIVSQRRQGNKNWKSKKDIDAAIEILKALENKGETKTIKTVFLSLPQKWQNKVLSVVENLIEKEQIIKILEN